MKPPRTAIMGLAGDIGGTKTHLALFHVDGKGPRLIQEQIFPSRNYSGLEAILKEWMRGKTHSVRVACFGVAGPVVQGRTKTTNLPWIVDAERIRRRFKMNSVILLNDLEATAYGALDLAKGDLRVLNPGQPDLPGNRAVIAAGTGLGEATLYWNGSDYLASASEGGHTDFAPRNPLEIRLLKYLLKRFGRVSYERVLSGSGLLNVYQFLKDTRLEKEPSWLAGRLEHDDPAAVMTEVALAGTVPLCAKALDLFVSLYGAEAGNLALKALATGGIYVGGGIAPKILDKLRNGAFMKAFTDKGRYASLMSRIPVWVILREDTALLGAVRVGYRRLRATDRRRHDRP